MLRQSARRRALQRYLHHSSEQLYLPWLCPALYQPRIRHSRHTQTLTRPATIPRKSSPSPPLSRQHQSRELASAATDSFYPVDDQYVPFNASYDPPDSVSNLFTNPPLYDSSNLLHLENSLPIEQKRLQRGAKSEVGGVASEIEATFQACLHVGRFDRAEGLVRRLAQVYESTSEELTLVNHQYVRNLLRSIEFGRKREDYNRLTNWIDKEMKKLDIPKDGLMYASLLRSAFLMLEDTQRVKAVKKYWKAVQNQQLEAQVIAVSVLTDADLGMLSEICPSELQSFADQYETTRSEDTMDTELESDIDINPSTDVATAPNPRSNPVRAVEQRGSTLKYLQESLTPLRQDEAKPEPWQTAEEYEKLAPLRLQEDLETSSVDAALRRWEAERFEATSIDCHETTNKLGPLLWQWQHSLIQSIEEELKLITEAENQERKLSADQDRLDYGPFLRLLPPERLAGLTIITFLSKMAQAGETNEMKISRMLVNMGMAVHMEAIICAVNDKYPEKGERKKILKWIEAIRKNEQGGSLWRTIVRLRELDVATEPSSALSSNQWSNVTYAKIGGILTHFMTEVAKVQVSVPDPESGTMIGAAQPAFQRNYKYELGKRVAFLTMHQKVADLLRKDPSPAFIVKHLPMVCPPKPWKGFLDGGYLKTTVPVIRLKNAVDSQRKYVEVAAARGDLKSFFAGLDILGRTSWKINQDVYKVMLQAWNSGEAIANIAPADFTDPPPSKPTDMSENPVAKRRWYTEMKQHENRKAALHSERCFQNLQMEMATNYLNKEFYLPHNADFRGRAYPLAPYLNQMGADNARALLLFGKGRPLGAEGLRWLKIHLANVFGFDKASFRDRELFAMEHLDDIRDSVENPLNGRRWWLQGEDPWQCLATCFELQHAFDSPDPLQYVSHLPVHQDGSCNGLQHYAALGGDIAGAQQVNLEPADKPSDVYTGVAELIKADIAKEAAEGRKIAQMLQGKIKRKIVKQTVMTNVYGVTYLGAMKQVRRQLEAHYPEMKRKDVAISGICAAYIARKIFNALGTLFTGAHRIQFWLGDCASRISASLTPEQARVVCEKTPLFSKLADSKEIKSLKKNPARHFRSGVTWTTPLNLTVVQPYRNVETTLVSTAFQQVSIFDPRETDTVDKRRQLQAFPPNFVHSLDATHMILSALRCNAAGLTFSAVHDSFWTHAADVNTMNRLLRDAFVQMHSEDIIGRLATEFKLRYSKHIFRGTIQGTKNPVRTKVMAWRKECLKQKRVKSRRDLPVFELKLEIQRQELLRSDDRLERELGAKMVTPASIYEELDGEQYLSTTKSLGETALGHIPETAPEEIIKSALNPETTDPTVDVDMEKSIAPIMSEEGTSSPRDTLSKPFTSVEESQNQPVSERVIPDLESSESITFVNEPQNQTLREQVIQSLGFSKDKQLSKEETLLVEMMEETRLEAQRNKENVKSSMRAEAIHIWLPLIFPEVPKRGEWDVSRLKNSDYFFS